MSGNNAQAVVGQSSEQNRSDAADRNGSVTGEKDDVNRLCNPEIFNELLRLRPPGELSVGLEFRLMPPIAQGAATLSFQDS